ncbi:regulation of enolase protein 1 (concanavalin A-like superfamily) [Paenibacillus endophyticus]|uniref:Regulation of enolase protein 1 (Concanavalin A-like superfamily) n=1 Tax=Paenibacillus endophyticus TaxID=1294268 RepID=A0A7W5G9U7_9BACL|nr:sugar-binding domain-containing protein [Paenibacillus endophyticus]MBB3151317.1 regulation of enolase protein 1 (concanavalin A-like superfamily) [Paenibacillus endophyticus]
MLKRSKAISMIVALSMLFTLLSSALSFTPRAAAAEEASAPEYHGLKVEYCLAGGPPDFSFGTFKGTGYDPNLDISNLEPSIKMYTGQENRVGIRWTGFIEPAYNENYTFYITGDNGFRLWIDNKLTIDHWAADWDKEQTSLPVALTAGQKYSIKLELFEDNGGSNVHMRWSSPSVAKEPVPTEAFYLPDGFAPGGTVLEDGLHAELPFPEALKPLTPEFLNHLRVSISTGNIAIASAALKEGDDKVIAVTFKDPLYSKDVGNVKVSYDGLGGLTTQAGSAIPGFDKPMLNGSKYQIMSPWADDVDKENVLPEYPRPQLARDEWINLNGEWEFEAAKKGEAIPSGKTLKEKILVPFAAEAKLSGINRVEDLMWYKRSFTIPDNWDGQRVKLHFGAVDYLATVYVNGQLAGSHKGGFTSFSFDITDYLAPGDNELIVNVLDETDMGADQAVGKQTVKKLGGIWYTSVSGIWQTVWLEPVAEAHIDKLDMATDIHDGVLKLTAAGSGIQGETVEAVVLTNGEVVGSATGAIGSEIKVAVPNARLWSPDDPFLYDLKVYVKDGGQTIDEVTSYFGMREIKLGKVDGITRPLLNGEFVFQMGPLDQGYWPDGIYTAPTDEALKFDIEAVKRVGMNTIRKHIKVEPARWYYWADKLGVLVWQDMPSLEDRQGNKGADITQATKTQWFKEYKEMVDQLRSVTSIIIWTVFNEGWGQFDQGGQQTRDATAYVKSLDSTRLVNSTSGWWDAGAGDLLDVHRYPDPGAPNPSDTRAAVLGEYGGLGLHVPGHEWSPLVFSYQLMNSKEQLTSTYVNYVNRLKAMKETGLSAAIYTQITDVEYEINGLLSYDRKVEKIDFNRIATAHRELIGTATKVDLLAELEVSETFLGKAKPGTGAGEYKQASIDVFAALVEAAKETVQDEQAGQAAIQQSLKALQTGRAQFFTEVNAPIPAGSAVDGFDAAALDSAWKILRADNTKWSLTSKPGFLSLATSTGETFQNTNTLPNIFLQDAPAGDFTITTKIDAAVRKNFQQAGLLLWQNDDNYVKLGHVWDTEGATGKSIETAYEKNAVYTKAANMAKHPGYDTSYLQLRKIGNIVSTFYWDGTAWKPAADPVTVSLSNLKIGFYGLSAGDQTSVQANFDYFSAGPVTNADKAALQAAVAAAEALLASAVVGTDPGQYPQSAKDAFAAAVAAAKATAANQGAAQAEVDAAIGALVQAQAIFTASVIPVTANAAATISGVSQVRAGQTFDLLIGNTGITAENAQTLYAQMLTVSFDPAKVAFVEAASLHAGFGVLEQKTIEPGKVRIIAAGQGNGLAANSQWLKLSFLAAASGASGSAQITVSGVEAANGEGDELIIEGASHAIQISAQVDLSGLNQAIAAAETIYEGAQVGTQPGQYPHVAKAALGAAISKAKAVAVNPNATELQVAAAITELGAAVSAFQASVLSGDINNDQKITIGDLGILASAYGKTNADPNWLQFKKSDLNADGKIDIEDIAMLARWILG